MTPDLGPTGLLVLLGGVAFGAVVPVLPTGALVSAAAALAADDRPWELVLVVLVGATGAWVGDVTTYAVLRGAGAGLAQRVGWLRPEDPEAQLHRIRDRIERHELRTLLVSRLVPGGRVPVLLVAALTGYSRRRFAGAAVAAATLWSLAYAAVGVIGGRLVDDATLAVVVTVAAAILLTTLVQAVPRVVRSLRS